MPVHAKKKEMQKHDSAHAMKVSLFFMFNWFTKIFISQDAIDFPIIFYYSGYQGDL